MPEIAPKRLTSLYAIIDKKADAIVGGIQLHKHEASAVRSFTDIASDPQTIIARHPEDFLLVCIGGLTEEHTIVATERPVVILTGSAWKASQTPTEDKQS